MLKKKTLAQMRIDHINERVIETTQFDGSGSHVNCALRTLRRMLRLAQEWNLIVRVPRIKLARENRRTATFDPSSGRTALDALKQPWCDVFMLMYDAGMRDEEAVSARWEYIDFAKCVIFNPRVKAEDTDGRVPLSERLKHALKARHRGQKHSLGVPVETIGNWAPVSERVTRLCEDAEGDWYFRSACAVLGAAYVRDCDAGDDRRRGVCRKADGTQKIR